MGLDVDTDAMRSHAQRVQGLAGKAGQAVAAADQVSFSSEMYGRFGALLVWPFMLPLQEAGATSTRVVKDALADTGRAVRATADTFDFVEDAVVQVMKAHARTIA